MHKINVTYSSTCYFTPLCRTEALSEFLLLKGYCNEVHFCLFNMRGKLTSSNLLIVNYWVDIDDTMVWGQVLISYYFGKQKLSQDLIRDLESVVCKNCRRSSPAPNPWSDWHRPSSSPTLFCKFCKCIENWKCTGTKKLYM